MSSSASSGPLEGACRAACSPGGEPGFELAQTFVSAVSDKLLGALCDGIDRSLDTRKLAPQWSKLQISDISASNIHRMRWQWSEPHICG